MNKILATLLIFFTSEILWSQEKFSAFFEPEIEVSYKVSDINSHSFSIENRNLIYEDNTLEYVVKQIEISHTSTFELRNNFEVGLGIQYRFEDIFDTSEENEFRLLQEIDWKKEFSYFSFKNRVRNEQRFYASTTKYRLRNETGLEFPLKNNEDTYLKIELEALVELAKTQKPELEQRFSFLVGNSLYPKTNLETGLQYRLADYTQDLSHELFIVIGLEIDLLK